MAIVLKDVMSMTAFKYLPLQTHRSEFKKNNLNIDQELYIYMNFGVKTRQNF